MQSTLGTLFFSFTLAPLLPVIISLLLVFLLLSTLGNLLDYISSPFSLSFFLSFSHFSHLPTLVHSRSPFSRSLLHSHPPLSLPFLSLSHIITVTFIPRYPPLPLLSYPLPLTRS
ncbi:hypothetical protein BKA57DRAFT_473974 [Linnemannia elongata]|nr:hypothetical protein BKA57DRAFT_473974 [Linnemannia elongata]